MLFRLLKKIILCVLLFVPLSLTAAPYAKIVVFGDSLSDMGNLATLSGYEFLNNAPYKHGFTNGITAVGYLAKSLGLPLKSSLHLTGLVRGNNFAVAGAKLSANDLTDLGAQISSFLASQSNKARADALYVVFLGGNDIRDMRDKPAMAATVLKNATINMQKALMQLIKAGATHFLVVNAPDLGLIPETHAKPALIKRTTQKSIAFNKGLAGVVTQIKKTKGVRVVLFDLMAFLNGIVTNGKAYHFNNTQQACYNSTSFKYYAVCNSAKMNSFLFFDEIHPTQRVHERMGRAFFAALPEAN